MTKAEMALNRSDLDNYLKGEIVINTMIPGIQSIP